MDEGEWGFIDDPRFDSQGQAKRKSPGFDLDQSCSNSLSLVGPTSVPPFGLLRHSFADENAHTHHFLEEGSLPLFNVVNRVNMPSPPCFENEVSTSERGDAFSGHPVSNKRISNKRTKLAFVSRFDRSSTGQHYTYSDPSLCALKNEGFQRFRSDTHPNSTIGPATPLDSNREFYPFPSSYQDEPKACVQVTDSASAHTIMRAEYKSSCKTIPQAPSNEADTFDKRRQVAGMFSELRTLLSQTVSVDGMVDAASIMTASKEDILTLTIQKLRHYRQQVEGLETAVWSGVEEFSKRVNSLQLVVVDHKGEEESLSSARIAVCGAMDAQDVCEKEELPHPCENHLPFKPEPRVGFLGSFAGRFVSTVNGKVLDWNERFAATVDLSHGELATILGMRGNAICSLVDTDTSRRMVEVIPAMVCGKSKAGILRGVRSALTKNQRQSVSDVFASVSFGKGVKDPKSGQLVKPIYIHAVVIHHGWVRPSSFDPDAPRRSVGE